MRDKKEIIFFFVPIAFMIISIFFWRYLFAAVAIVSIIPCVAACRSCRRNESLWIFMFVALCTIPLNIGLTTKMALYITDVFSELGSIILFLKYIFIGVLYSMLLSIEEIIIGLIGRCIWKEQDEFYNDTDSEWEEEI